MALKFNPYNVDTLDEGIRKMTSEQKASGIINYIIENTERSLPDDAELTSLLSQNSLQSTFLIADEEERAARRQLSQDAWNQMLTVVSSRVAMDEAIKGQDLPTQAKRYDELLQTLDLSQSPEDLLALSDQDLVAKFPDIYALYRIAQDADQLLDPNKPDTLNDYLSEESREILRKLSDNLPAFTALMGRHGAICDPYYEKVNVVGLANESNALTNANNAADRMERSVRRRIAASEAVPDQDIFKFVFFKQLAGFAAGIARLFGWRLSNELRDEAKKNEFDLTTLKIVDLSQKEYSLNAMSDNHCENALKQGKPLIFRDNTGKNVLAFRVDGGKFVPTKAETLVEQAVYDATHTRVDELVELATGKVADPVWMLTGSSQYRDLKNALAKHAKASKLVSNPPTDKELKALKESVEYLHEASITYLKYKDPTITADMTFEQYMAEKGSALNLSEREQARLKSAFLGRDLAVETPRTIALGWSLGIKNRKVMEVDNVFYQGLLRKYQALENELEKAMTDETTGPEFLAQIDQLISDNNMFLPENPYPDNPTATLLWESRQMLNLIERTEIAMGLRAKDRAIDPEEKARIEVRKAFGEQDIADLSASELNTRLEESFKAAVKAQEEKAQAEKENEKEASEPKLALKEGGLKLNYSPKEFISSKTLTQGDAALSNSSAEVKSFKNRKQGILKSGENAVLDHRIKGLEIIEYLEENNPSRPPLTGYTATRNGQPVEGEPKKTDKIMLPGVHERRSQNTMNGCWSVTLSSQFEYRGVSLPQEVIRAYRPNPDELDALIISDEKIQEFYENRKQTVGDYSGLAARMLPNSAFLQTVINWNNVFPGQGPERAISLFKDVVFNALTKENSPLSLCAGGHYLTIVGMEDDKVFVKNPMHIFGGNPETIETWTIDQLMRKAKNQLELNWFSDVTPSLGGSIEPGLDWCKEGTFYGNGRSYSALTDEFENPLKNEKMLGSGVDITYSNSYMNKVHIQTPTYLKYKRLPNSHYNADILKSMETKLLDFYKSGPDGQKLPIPGAIGSVLEEMQNLQLGVHKQDTERGMLELATKYVDALKAVKEAQTNAPSEQMQKLQNTLTEHLKNVHRAILDTREIEYKNLIGSPEGLFHKPKEGTPPDKMDKLEKAYMRMEQGFAGMLYFHEAKALPLEEGAWIRALDPKVVKKGVSNIKGSAGFQSLMNEIVDHSASAKIYLGQNSEYQKLKAEVKKQEKELAKAKPQNTKEDAQNKIDAYRDSNTLQQAKEKLEKMEETRNFILKQAGLDPNEVTMKRELDFQTNILLAKTVRLTIRGGNTASFYRRYYEHKVKVSEKSNPEMQKVNVVDKQYVKTEAEVTNQKPQAPGPAKK